MIVYHIDRSKHLSANQILTCIDGFKTNNVFDYYNNSLSIHGLRYLTQNLFNNINSSIWEISLEYMRILKYSNYPSRFNCLFAVESIEQLDPWKSFFDNQSCQIAKIECSKFHKFDANWITHPRERTGLLQDK